MGRTTGKCHICPDGNEMRLCHLYEHLRNVHGLHEQEIDDIKRSFRPQSSSLPTTTASNFPCNYCERSYSIKSSLDRHMKADHGENRTSKAYSVKCPLCSLAFLNQKQLVSHVAFEHNEDDVAVNEEYYEFPSWDAFTAWKDDVQQRTISNYVTRTTDKTREGKRVYFRCAHSGGTGITADPTQLTARHRVSRKVHSHCPATMTAYDRNGKVCCVVVFQHLGHEQRTALLPLPNTVEQEIKRYLADGLTPHQIVDKLQLQNWDDTKSSSDQCRACYVTVRDIFDLSNKYGLICGRRDANDLTSFEKLLEEFAGQTGPYIYHKARDSKGDGFLLATLLPGGKDALVKYGKRGLVFDDTFHVTTYSFRLATLICLDHSDNGIPVGIVLSNKMSSEEVAKLFTLIKTTIPGFKSDILMSDDTLVFWNAYVSVFGCVGTRKLLCSWHIGQTIGRRVPELIEDPFTRKIAIRLFKSLMRLPDKSQFNLEYDKLLTWLAESKQLRFLEYLEKNYSNRLYEWAPCYRARSPMNTSMHAEAFHSQLKCHVLERKQNCRLDTLYFLLLQYTRSLSMKRAAKDNRLLLQGNSRKSKNIQRHKDAVEFYKSHIDSIEQVGPAYWVVQSRQGNHEYYVQVVDQCSCDQNVNNHCPSCGVCAYTMVCTCADSVQSGVCCVHRHAVASFNTGCHYVCKPEHALKASTKGSSAQVYAEIPSSSRLSEGEEGVEDEFVDVEGDWNYPEPSRHDEVSELLQEEQSTGAAIHQLFLKLSKDVSNLPALRDIQAKQAEIYDMLNQLTLGGKEIELARREVVSKPGRTPADATIRKIQSRGVILRKRNEDKRQAENIELDEALPYAHENLQAMSKKSLVTCAICHRREPLGNLGNIVDWLACDNEPLCGILVHEDCNAANTKCNICEMGIVRKRDAKDY